MTLCRFTRLRPLSSKCRGRTRASTRACHGRREYDAYNGQGIPTFNGFSRLHSTNRSQTLRPACVSCTLAETGHNIVFIFGGIRRRTALFSGLPRHGMIRRCKELTMAVTNSSCGMFPRKRAATRGSTVCLIRAFSIFLLLTKLLLQCLTLPTRPWAIRMTT